MREGKYEVSVPVLSFLCLGQTSLINEIHDSVVRVLKVKFYLGTRK